jgi:hypothetical protein
MIEINIAKDFAETPGARLYSDGPKSGQEFFDVMLKGKFSEALEGKTKLKIILDGTDGFPSSFLNEAFRRLAETFGQDIAWNNLFLISNEVPKYIQKIKEAIYETQK